MKKDKIIIREILFSAQELLQRFGFDKTTMADIAKNAGKGKSTLYHYFKSKDEIFNQVIKMEMDTLFQKVKKAVDLKENCNDKLKEYILIKIKTLKEKRNLYHFAIQTDTDSLNKFISLFKKRYDKKEKEILNAILVQGVENKDLTIENERIEPLSELIVSCIRGIEFDILTKNEINKLFNQADFLTNIIIKGLR
ncbi:TetR/AcrR family transcriptional regulator [Lutibacter sp. B1]|uniref:TetR/AcrR family transcriptional regulator n=1 Tax=Lutibacter sp. B1 TaxID=2725996 RepID=UPI0014578497|nr:TetR/AcrR family transcriptional regulator [Lutibacter sp. B1]NLP59043.1 TetR/AcrR family transcriptional regulator [Lutibacter sp. B1]